MKLMAQHQELAKNDDWYWFGVFEKKTGRLIGHIDFDVDEMGSSLAHASVPAAGAESATFAAKRHQHLVFAALAPCS